MKKSLKITLFSLILSVIVFLNPSFSEAKTTTVNDEAGLISAVTTAEDGDVIELSTDITLTKPLEITEKNIAIDGKNHTITREDTNWTPNGDNSTLITAGGDNTTLNLVNLTLTKSAKYGVQSYNGAHVILDNVTISDCGFGGVLINAGTVEVKNLHLGKNGASNNNGIEISKGSSLVTGDKNPKLIMNGTLTSTETENVVYIAENDDNLTTFEVENGPNTTDKVLVSGGKIVITDNENNIKFESNSNPEVTAEGQEYVENVTITVNLMEQPVKISVQKGTTLTRQYVESKISLADLGLSNYTIEGFYTDAVFTTAYNFTTPITADATIYAKLALIQTNQPDVTPEQPKDETPAEPEEKPIDETPKTGYKSYPALAMSILVLSMLGIAIFKKGEKSLN